jgi:puromycin-sensitive aminopeptidase
MKCVISALVFLTLTGVSSAQRLPQTAVPVAYRLTLAPDFQKDNFTGDETIEIQVLEATKTITLNAAEIEFGEVTIAEGGNRQKAAVETDPKKEMATLTVEHELAAGPAEMAIRYTGILNDKLRGFYLAKANKRKYAVTQFESTDARRAFPCFDEPADKASFDISLVVDKGDTAISNGRIVSDTPGPGAEKHTLKFSTTPKMSSYLVAMAVGDFKCLEGSAGPSTAAQGGERKSNRGTPIRVCATPDKAAMEGFALESAEHILDFYNQYFGVKYPFEKLDILGAPDFEAGAMENTGAIFAREVIIVIDDQAGSVWLHRSVADVLAHEMAHQWFGDLVTMQWWDDIFLNEGFATWMAPKPIEAWKPEWNEDLDEAQGTGWALDSDSAPSTRPIHAQHVETPAEIQNLFDGIAYGKTAAVLRMIESYLGPEVFRAGVNAYLQKHAYGNATAEDFWNQLAETSRKPVKEIMQTFVLQAGPPLVTVAARCEGEATDITLSQQRYFYDRDLLNAGSDELWQVPVCLKWPAAPQSGGEMKTQCERLSEKRQSFQLSGCAPWVFANAGAKGYYRSAYDPETIHQLSAMAEEKLTPAERIAFLNDLWAMVRVGKSNIADYLALVEDLKPDRTRAVVDMTAGRVGDIGDHLVGDSDREAYRAWVRAYFRPLFDELGWQPAAGESDERKALRSEVIGTLGVSGRDPEILAQARELAQKYMHEPSAVDATLAGTVLYLAALNGDEALYNQFLAHAKSAQTPEDYYRYLGTLAAFSDPKLLERTLALSLSDEIRNQDVGQVLGGVTFNPEGRELGWNFVKSRYDELVKKLPAFGAVGLIYSGSTFCDPAKREEVRQFFTAHMPEGGERALKQTLENVKYCSDLKSAQEANLATWLGSHGAHAGR